MVEHGRGMNRVYCKELNRHCRELYRQSSLVRAIQLYKGCAGSQAMAIQSNIIPADKDFIQVIYLYIRNPIERIAFSHKRYCTNVIRIPRKSSSSSFGFSHQGSPQRIFLLQLFLSTVSSSVTSTSAMSSFTTSINLLFGIPHFLFPGNSILSILLPIDPSSFLRRWPYHLSLASRVFSPNFPTCADVLIPDLVHSCHS